VLNREDNNFFGVIIYAVVDQIFAFSDGKLADAFRCLSMTDVRKLNEVLQTIKNGGADTCRALRAQGDEVSAIA